MFQPLPSLPPERQKVIRSRLGEELVNGHGEPPVSVRVRHHEVRGGARAQLGVLGGGEEQPSRPEAARRLAQPRRVRARPRRSSSTSTASMNARSVAPTPRGRTGAVVVAAGVVGRAGGGGGTPRRRTRRWPAHLGGVLGGGRRSSARGGPAGLAERRALAAGTVEAVRSAATCRRTLRICRARSFQIIGT